MYNFDDRIIQFICEYLRSLFLLEKRKYADKIKSLKIGCGKILTEVKHLCKEFGFTSGMLKGSLAKVGEEVVSTMSHVLYSKIGDFFKDSFETLQVTIKDYQIKLEVNKEWIFDDCFIFGIEDNDGKVANVKI
jgi:hypothetical protein